MASTTEPTGGRTAALLRWAPVLAVAALLGGAVVVALRFGAPAVILWLAFAALAGAILLFWESFRTAMEPGAPGDEPALEAGASAPSDLEEKKRAALRALRDIEFEHSIHRISDEDYAGLKEHYRAQAREAMEAIDTSLGAYLAQADALIARAGQPGAPSDDAKVAGAEGAEGAERTAGAGATAGKKRKAVKRSDARCPKCATANDADAVFCKRCGQRVAAEA